MKTLVKILNKIPTWVSSACMFSLVAYASLNDAPFRGYRIIFFPGADKCIHFLMYFFLNSAFLFDYTKLKLPHHTKVNIELVLTFTSIVLGVVFEVLQTLITETRTFEFYDMVTNAAGAICSFLFMRYWFCKKFRRTILKRRTKRSRRHKK